MARTEIKIGYAPTRRNVFSAQEAQRHKKLTLEKIRQLGARVVDIDDINEEGLLFGDADVNKIVSKFRAEEVDGVFFPHCNFGTEDLVAKVSKALGKPVLLWGPRDDAPLKDGFRTRDTQCGLFATGKILRRFNVPFTYIVNSRVDEEVFTRGYINFTAVCSVVKAFRKIRILQIAPRPAGFWTMICNEGELLERFGIEVVPITLQDIATGVSEIHKQKGMEYTSNLDAFKSGMDVGGISGADIEKLAALKTLIRKYCLEYDCSAAAIQCWNALQDATGIMPCVVNGMLTEEWLPVTCETDIHGAVSSIMLQEAAMRTSPVFFADLTVRHPQNDNAELLWHCGNFPPSLAKEGTCKAIGRHFIFPSHCAGTGEWELKGGDITVCRFDGDHGEYSLLFGEGKGVEGPRTKGTYVWFEVKDWPRWEEKIVTGPYVHHCAGVHAKTASVLYEACKYIPGLKADPVEPCEEEIGRYLRGV